MALFQHHAARHNHNFPFILIHPAYHLIQRVRGLPLPLESLQIQPECPLYAGAQWGLQTPLPTTPQRRRTLWTWALSPQGCSSGPDSGSNISLICHRVQNHRLGRKCHLYIALPFCKHCWLLLNKRYLTLNARIRHAILRVCDEIKNWRQDWFWCEHQQSKWVFENPIISLQPLTSLNTHF